MRIRRMAMCAVTLLGRPLRTVSGPWLRTDLEGAEIGNQKAERIGALGKTGGEDMVASIRYRADGDIYPGFTSRVQPAGQPWGTDV